MADDLDDFVIPQPIQLSLGQPTAECLRMGKGRRKREKDLIDLRTALNHVGKSTHIKAICTGFPTPKPNHPPTG